MTILEEALNTTAVNLRCKCSDISLLKTACQIAVGATMDGKEQYLAMLERLEELSAEMDSRLDAKIDCLNIIHRRTK